MTENDIFDNRLIFGDNLLALKALEHEYAGKVKCIYIDPPFNTKQAFEHYDDGLEHSVWLSLMRDRLILLHRLLSNDGTCCIHIDDNELGYLLVIADEIFGRSNRAYIVTFKQSSVFWTKSNKSRIGDYRELHINLCKREIGLVSIENLCANKKGLALQQIHREH